MFLSDRPQIKPLQITINFLEFVANIVRVIHSDQNFLFSRRGE